MLDHIREGKADMAKRGFNKCHVVMTRAIFDRLCAEPKEDIDPQAPAVLGMPVELEDSEAPILAQRIIAHHSKYPSVVFFDKDGRVTGLIITNS